MNYLDRSSQPVENKTLKVWVLRVQLIDQTIIKMVVRIRIQLHPRVRHLRETEYRNRLESENENLQHLHEFENRLINKSEND